MEYKFSSRFWEKVKKTKTCWIWQSCKNEHGYGTFSINNYPHKAHRVSYAIEYGPFDHSQCVLHKCDNPECVNPNHLFLGSQHDNMKDMVAKGRQRKTFPINTNGTNNINSKLSPEKVKEIRNLYRPNIFSRSKLSRKYGVSKSTIDSILSGKTWGHVK